MENKNRKKSRSGRIFYNIAILISALVFVAVFVGMMVFSLFFSRTEQSAYDKNLTKLPEFTLQSFFSGEYTTQLSHYFTDTIHNRDIFKENASKIKLYYGLEDDEEHFVIDTSVPDTPSLDESSDTSLPEKEESSAPDISTDTSVDVSQDVSADISQEEPSKEESSEPPTPPPVEILNNIVLLGSGSNIRAMEVYYHSDSAAAAYANLVNSFAAKVPGVKVYSMVIPKQCAFYIAGDKYGSTKDNSLKTDNAIKERLDGVIYVDAYHALEKHTDEEIYARTDHHWTGLGAYYAAEEFAKTANVPFAGLDFYDLNRRSGYVGTMYTFTKSAKLLNNPEDFITLVPKTTHMADFFDKNFNFVTEHDIFWHVSDSMRSGWYSTFLGNDDYMVKIKSPVCNNSRKLLIIKDSYGNALSPLFMQSFEEIYIADLRYMNVNALDFIEKHGITDVLFAMCSYSAVNSNINSRIDAITKIGR